MLVRNPYFKDWSKDAQPAGYPDEITERFDLTGEAEVTQVENGQADWIGYSIPSDRLNEIATKYPKQLFLNQLTAMWYVPMNTSLAPFNNLKARQAVNYAVDRAAMVRLFGGTAARARPAARSSRRASRVTSTTAPTPRTRARRGRRPTWRRRSSS